MRKVFLGEVCPELPKGLGVWSLGRGGRVESRAVASKRVAEGWSRVFCVVRCGRRHRGSVGERTRV